MPVLIISPLVTAINRNILIELLLQ